MTISFIGHGYVGLVTACVFADFGNTVWVVGRSPEKLERLKQADPIIYEPGLEEMLKDNLEKGRIRFTDDYAEAIPQSEVVFIAVGTPPGKDGHADLTSVLAVAREIGANLKQGYTVVSCKSTVPVGTNLEVKKILEEVKPEGAEIDIASCPEFLREGTGINDTLYPDRIVIGSETKRAAEKVLEAHKPLPGKRVLTDLASAELIKYASNSMLATKISFANLISFYCDKTGADVEQVLEAVGIDKRIGRTFLYPGVGYGGSCFPKDVQALTSTGKQLGIDTALLEAVEAINEQSAENFIKKITENTQQKRIAIWGLAFKPDTDDIRFAPSLKIIKALLEQDYDIHVYDSEALEHVKNQFGDAISYYTNQYDAVQDANALCVVTEWNEFKQANLSEVKKRMADPLIFDGRNIYQPDKMKELGFTYISIGRNPVR